MKIRQSLLAHWVPIAVLVLSGTIFGNGGAQAATAYAAFDWSGMNVTAQGSNGGNVNWEWSGFGGTDVQAETFSSFPFDSSFDWTTPVDALATEITGDQGHAHGDSTSLFASANVTSADGFASAMGDRYDTLFAWGQGILTIEIPFQVNVTADPLNNDMAYANASLNITDQYNQNSSHDLFVDELSSFTSQSGLLRVNVSVSGGDQFNPLAYDFNAHVEAVASASPVPLPGAVWLLGSALLGMAPVARRRLTH